jgi:hypothetical protein
LKRLVSLILILLISLCFFSSVAVVEAKGDGYVTISFEDYGNRGSDGGDFPNALGIIISKTKVKIHSNDTIATATLRLLKSKGITYYNTGTAKMGGGFYLQSIDNFTTANGKHISDGYGLGEFSAGSDSGWMVSYNNWFINKGASEFYVEDGDYIRWQFTATGQGKDIGCDWENPSATIIDIEVDKGTLSPAFSTSIKNYTLVVDSSVKSVAFEAKQENYWSKVTYSSNGKTYKCLSQIPVKNNTKIIINSQYTPKAGEDVAYSDKIIIKVQYKSKSERSTENNSSIKENTTQTATENINAEEKTVVNTTVNKAKSTTVTQESTVNIANETDFENETATSAIAEENNSVKEESASSESNSSDTDFDIFYLLIIILGVIVIAIAIVCLMIFRNKRER